MSLTPNTHLTINQSLCGQPLSLSQGEASVRLPTTPQMVADARGLVHGGFVFGAVDYAAMLAVNDPHVVLGGAEVRLTAPVEVGQEVIAHAKVVASKGRRHNIEVRACVGEREVMTGTMTAFVLEKHVLDT